MEDLRIHHFDDTLFVALVPLELRVTREPDLLGVSHPVSLVPGLITFRQHRAKAASFSLRVVQDLAFHVLVPWIGIDVGVLPSSPPSPGALSYCMICVIFSCMFIANECLHMADAPSEPPMHPEAVKKWEDPSNVHKELIATVESP